MNNDLISREALKAHARKVICGDNPTNTLLIRMFDEIIDNAPAATDRSVEIAQKSIELGRRLGRLEEKVESQRPQGEFEITNEDINQAIKEGFANGYEMAKEKIIHSIAKQYSEHNELVPIWLSIGDIKDGADNG